MNKENKDIEILIEKFFAGETTNREEQDLNLFFKQGNIPEDFIKYIPVFRYFEEDIKNEVDANRVLPSHRKLSIKWFLRLGIAASVLLFGLTWFYFTNRELTEEYYEITYFIYNDEDDIEELKIATLKAESALQQLAGLEQEIKKGLLEDANEVEYIYEIIPPSTE